MRGEPAVAAQRANVPSRMRCSRLVPTSASRPNVGNPPAPRRRATARRAWRGAAPRRAASRRASSPRAARCTADVLRRSSSRRARRRRAASCRASLRRATACSATAAARTRRRCRASSRRAARRRTAHWMTVALRRQSSAAGRAASSHTARAPGGAQRGVLGPCGGGAAARDVAAEHCRRRVVLQAAHYIFVRHTRRPLQLEVDDAAQLALERRVQDLMVAAAAEGQAHRGRVPRRCGGAARRRTRAVDAGSSCKHIYVQLF
ncbi:hypothetical protein JKP88DRAFT_251966 [Tribonema minus]|uniref:Uncharacterized protein n=1 Tax=Tribonema minus TaxID=303371 RepID=A0A836CLE1_9STRA|nr:hypothetical protein JKP88DRAFT_251966 [Tribonema minus]